MIETALALALWYFLSALHKRLQEDKKRGPERPPPHINPPSRPRRPVIHRDSRTNVVWLHFEEVPPGTEHDKETSNGR